MASPGGGIQDGWGEGIVPRPEGSRIVGSLPRCHMLCGLPALVPALLNSPTRGSAVGKTLISRKIHSHPNPGTWECGLT